MFKIIAKTALKVLVAVIIALIIAFAVASLGFPKSMAGFFEKQGAYSFAGGYASLQYGYSGKTEDLARCVQDYVLAENDKNTVKFGDKLAAAEDFDGFSESETARLGFDYKQYICGKIACAKYRNGDKDGALVFAKTAVEESGRFAKNNALVQLVLEIYGADDADAARAAKPVLENVPHSEDDSEYLLSIIKVLDNIIG